jgi:hypothetical protein
LRVSSAVSSSYYWMREALKARSVGRIASDPYTRKKGEYPIAELTWVRRPQIT